MQPAYLHPMFDNVRHLGEPTVNHPTDDEIKQYIADQAQKAMEGFVGQPVTAVAKATVLGFLEGVLRDAYAATADDIVRELGFDVAFEGAVMKVSLYPKTERARDWMKAGLAAQVRVDDGTGEPAVEVNVAPPAPEPEPYIGDVVTCECCCCTGSCQEAYCDSDDD